MRPSTIACLLAYRGDFFHGFQRQGELPTVERSLRLAISKTTGPSKALVPAGRTDAGVHAIGQVVSFRVMLTTTPSQLLQGLNEQLPREICIRGLTLADPKFHARARAQSKTYRYIIEQSDLPMDQQRLAWRIAVPLQLAAMKTAAQYLIGNYDCSTFRSKRCHAKSALCHIRSIEVWRMGNRILVDITANRFLRKMARTLVGLLAEVGCGLRRPQEVPSIRDCQQRSAAGITAPARGLYLLRVHYSLSDVGLLSPAGASELGSTTRSTL